MKEYNIAHSSNERIQYCTNHTVKFDGIEGQLRLDKIEQFKKSLSMQEAFYAYEKDTELVTKMSLIYLKYWRKRKSLQ